MTYDLLFIVTTDSSAVAVVAAADTAEKKSLKGKASKESAMR